MKVCDCEDWKENIETIDSAVMSLFMRGSKRSVKTFEYCPWCGKKLAEIAKDD